MNIGNMYPCPKEALMPTASTSSPRVQGCCCWTSCWYSAHCCYSSQRSSEVRSHCFVPNLIGEEPAPAEELPLLSGEAPAGLRSVTTPASNTHYPESQRAQTYSIPSWNHGSQKYHAQYGSSALIPYHGAMFGPSESPGVHPKFALE